MIVVVVVVVSLHAAQRIYRVLFGKELSELWPERPITKQSTLPPLQISHTPMKDGESKLKTKN